MTWLPRFLNYFFSLWHHGGCQRLFLWYEWNLNTIPAVVEPAKYFLDFSLLDHESTKIRPNFRKPNYFRKNNLYLLFQVFAKVLSVWLWICHVPSMFCREPHVHPSSIWLKRVRPRRNRKPWPHFTYRMKLKKHCASIVLQQIEMWLDLYC